MNTKVNNQHNRHASIRFLVCITLVAILLPATIFARTTYTISFPDRNEHYINVEIKLDELRGVEYIDFKMPVWTPGSYLIREFARNVVHVTAFVGTKPVEVVKIDKQTWRVQIDKKRNMVLKYKVYAFEVSVRTSFVDGEGAMLNGASVFMYPVGMEQNESLIVVDKPRSWPNVTSGLPWVGGRSPVFRAENYDILVDSPIMIGNHDIIEFQVGGKTHRYALMGAATYDRERLIEDGKSIFEEMRKIFGTLPYDDYTIFVQMRGRGGGGLEHLNSTQIITSRWLGDDANHKRFLGTFAHEVFHLYNVKRIRPRPLGPFDYNNENYTTLLWVSEGLTSYFGPQLLLRGGQIDEKEYLKRLGSAIGSNAMLEGAKVQTLQEASYDAWIKFYRSNENSSNTAVSYYSKGALVGAALDLTIRNVTNGSKSLDDVFRALWQKYQGDGKGFTHNDFKSICEAMAGRNLDHIFKYVTTTEPFDWDPILQPFGLELIQTYSNPDDSAKAWYGFRTREQDGRMMITGVVSGSPAAKAGFSVYDELLSVDGFRLLGRDVQRILDSRKIGVNAIFITSRDGAVRTIRVKPESPAKAKFTVRKVDNPTDAQKALYKGWLLADWE